MRCAVVCLYYLLVLRLCDLPAPGPEAVHGYLTDKNSMFFFVYRLTYKNCGGSKPFDKVSM